MNQQVRILAHLRRHEDNAKSLVECIENEIATSGLGQKLARARDLLAATKLDRAEAEDNLRNIALAQYETDGDKQPHPAIGIAIYTILDYDEGQALDYARLHLPKALRLDKRVFEKAAKAIEPDFVTIGQEPRVRIASDLSQYLGGEQNDE